jgi:hypothetical protein
MKILALLVIGLLLATPAFAANNAVILVNGAGTMSDNRAFVSAVIDINGQQTACAVEMDFTRLDGPMNQAIIDACTAAATAARGIVFTGQDKIKLFGGIVR